MDPDQNNQGNAETGFDNQAVFTPQSEPLEPLQQPTEPPMQAEPQPPVVAEAEVLPAEPPEEPQQPEPLVSSPRPFLSSHPTRTYNSETGDIILNPISPKPKRNWRPFIIGGIVLAVFAVIGAIILLMAGGSGSNSATKLRQSFNEYANYFLYGTESDSNIADEYVYGDKYWFGTIGLDDETIEAHLNTSNAKYLKFQELYKNSNLEISEGLRDIIDGYYANFDIYRCLTLRPNLSASTLLEAYIENSSELKQKVDEYYNLYFESPVEATNQYAVDYKAKINRLLNAYQIYKSSGCIDEVNASISVACRDNATDENLVRANEIYTDFMDFYYSQSLFAKKAGIGPFQDIWYISRGLE